MTESSNPLPSPSPSPSPLPPSTPPPPLPVIASPLQPHLYTPPPKSLACSANKRFKRKPDLPVQPKAVPPCTECGKRFSSWKALCGHMRCHPERVWRGINPPPSLSQRAQFTDEEYQVAATLVFLANQPQAKVPSGSISATVISALSSSLDVAVWKRRKDQGKMFKTPFASSSSSSPSSLQDGCLLDLNVPPQLDSFEDGRSPALDLNL